MGGKLTADKAYIVFNFSESIRAFLIGSILFFAGISFLTVVIMLLHKMIVNSHTNRFQKLKTRYRQELTLLLFEPNTVSLSPVHHPLEIEAASDIAIELMESFNDPSYLTLLYRYLSEHSIIQYYSVLALRTNTAQQFASVERLAIFRYDKNRPLFIKILTDKKTDEEILINSLIGLSYIFNPEDKEVFLSSLEQIDSSEKFSEFLFYNVLQRLVSENRHETIDAIFSWLLTHNNPLSLKAFIEAISVVEYNPIASQLRSLYLSVERDDIKISIIRALGNLTGSEEGCTLFLDALKSDNTTLRIVASKSISNCYDEEVTKPASRALFDPSYSVRYNISRSLLRLPNGTNQLKSIVTTASDNYAKQSAVYALRLSEISHA
jgi:hypothetical protein